MLETLTDGKMVIDTGSFWEICLKQSVTRGPVNKKRSTTTKITSAKMSRALKRKTVIKMSMFMFSELCRRDHHTPDRFNYM